MTALSLLIAGFLGNKDQQKTAYGLLAVIWGIVAAAKIFATEQFIGHVFNLTAGQGLLGLQRLAGFSSLAPAVAAYTLAVGSSHPISPSPMGPPLCSPIIHTCACGSPAEALWSAGFCN